MLWSIVSKALDRSKYMLMRFSLLSILVMSLSTICKPASSVQCTVTLAIFSLSVKSPYWVFD